MSKFSPGWTALALGSLASAPAHALWSRANAAQSPTPLSLYDMLTFGCYVAGVAMWLWGARLFWKRDQQDQAFEAARQTGLTTRADVGPAPASTALGEAAPLWRSGSVLAWLASAVLLTIPTLLSSSH